MQTGATTRRFLVAVILLAGVFAGRIHGADTIHWRNIGPGGGGNIWITAVDPYNANIVLTGSDVGGIFRTRDGGLTWTIANDAAVQGQAVRGERVAHDRHDGSPTHDVLLHTLPVIIGPTPAAGHSRLRQAAAAL